jgi:glucose-6-phosphate isomerase
MRHFCHQAGKGEGLIFEQKILWPQTLSMGNFDFLEDIKRSDCFSIVKSADALSFTENPRLKQWMAHRNFVIFGTGGSSLGGQCIAAAFPDSEKTLRFVSNLDPFTLEREFSRINPEETGFLCISKSGETLETVAQTLLAINFAKSFGDFRDKFVFITEDNRSSLKEIAIHHDFLCLDHPKSIGGRFSLFTVVAMLPALLCGIDAGRILDGGRKVFDGSMDEIKRGASFVTESFYGGFRQHVSFIYSDKLSFFGRWLAQMYAESAGKSNKGITPITAIGTIDQHSQLQLYLDGGHDKCFTFFLEQQTSELRISDALLPTGFPRLANKRAFDIFEIQCEATMASILQKGYHLRMMKIPPITPEILGAMFMHFMLEVVCVCKLIGVNPFGQPAVEQGKTMAKKLLEVGRC